ncbi:MAG TPA: hypothetical protein VMR94_01250, partial [Hyphomicrobiaceae bacterium]|nr:hypothetical protein [Hyphomicrobiaceae bacterium]
LLERLKVQYGEQIGKRAAGLCNSRLCNSGLCNSGLCSSGFGNSGFGGLALHGGISLALAADGAAQARRL